MAAARRGVALAKGAGVGVAAGTGASGVALGNGAGGTTAGGTAGVSCAAAGMARRSEADRIGMDRAARREGASIMDGA